MNDNREDTVGTNTNVSETTSLVKAIDSRLAEVWTAIGTLQGSGTFVENVVAERQPQVLVTHTLTRPYVQFYSFWDGESSWWAVDPPSTSFDRQWRGEYLSHAMAPGMPLVIESVSEVFPMSMEIEWKLATVTDMAGLSAAYGSLAYRS